MREEQLQADGWGSDERTGDEDADKRVRAVQRGRVHTHGCLTLSTHTQSRSQSLTLSHNLRGQTSDNPAPFQGDFICPAWKV